jgi:hypothetical protein
MLKFVYLILNKNNMKALKKLLPAVAFFTVLLADSQTAPAQKNNSEKEMAIKTLVDSGQYIFYAASVTPMSGRRRFLTSGYTVAVSKDTVMADLPYFGRAYSAPINTTDGGIKFTSVNPDYKLTERKKGGWDVTIKPAGAGDVQQLLLTIYKNGSASLSIISNSRQPVSFSGYIGEKKKK